MVKLYHCKGNWIFVDLWSNRSTYFALHLQSVSRIWTSLTWWNLLMLVWYWIQANFCYCPSCLKKRRSLQNWSKKTRKKSSRIVILNPWHTSRTKKEGRRSFWNFTALINNFCNYQRQTCIHYLWNILMSLLFIHFLDKMI